MLVDDQITAGLLKVLTHLSPVGRKKAMREIMTFLRKSNRQRIKANKAPDGSNFAPRKNKKGKMFKKIGKSIKLNVTENSGEIGFYGRASEVASNHQFGKRIKYKNGDKTGYFDLAKRELLGLSDNDKRTVSDIIIKHLELA